jgi:hypothetical protein
MNDAVVKPRSRFSASRKPLLVTIPLAAVLFGLGVAYYRYQYPYGWSHCCDKQLAMALANYADVNGGTFPTGGATPEASLSLLYPRFLQADVLCGKTVPVANAERLLDAGLPLTPSTCDWHYVDGLTLPANVGLANRIAIAWDKVGLGHNGERLPDGGHCVVFMGFQTRYVNQSDWPRFIADQQVAWAAIRSGGGAPGIPWIPGEP